MKKIKVNKYVAATFGVISLIVTLFLFSYQQVTKATLETVEEHQKHLKFQEFQKNIEVSQKKNLEQREALELNANSTDEQIYGVIFRFLQTKNALEEEIIKSYIKYKFNITNPSAQSILMGAANSYSNSVNSIQANAGLITEQYHVPNATHHSSMSSTHKNVVAGYRAQKEQLAADTASYLQSDLGPEWIKFNSVLMSSIKPYIREIIIPNDPTEPRLERRIGWYYQENWWKPILTQDSVLAISDPSEGIEIYSNATTRMFGRASSDMNPAFNGHGLDQRLSLTNNFTGEVVDYKQIYVTTFNSDTTLASTVSVDIPDIDERLDGGNGFTFGSEFHPVCNFFGNFSNEWDVGTTFLRYDKSYQNGPGHFQYKHWGDHCVGNTCASCPTYCGTSTWIREFWAVTCIGSGCDPGPKVRISIPYGPLGCLRGGIVSHNSLILDCYDIGNN